MRSTLTLEAWEFQDITLGGGGENLWSLTIYSTQLP